MSSRTALYAGGCASPPRIQPRFSVRTERRPHAPATRAGTLRAHRRFEVALVRARLDDLRHLLGGEPDLVVRVGEVRAEPDARLRTRVAEDLARLELALDRLELRRAHDERAAAALRLLRPDDVEAGALEHLGEERGLLHRTLPNTADSDLLDQVVARRRRVERRDVRCAGEEARGAGRVLLVDLELEGAGVRLPARQRRLQPLPHVWSHVEPAGAGTAAQPLDAAADGEVDAERAHVER